MKKVQKENQRRKAGKYCAELSTPHSRRGFRDIADFGEGRFGVGGGFPKSGGGLPKGGGGLPKSGGRSANTHDETCKDDDDRETL